MSEPVRYEPGRVTRLVFNRPQVKNALDARCWELLAQGLDEFAADPAARVLVLSGAGGDFSAGADLGGGITGSADAVAAKMREIAGIVLRLHEMPKPTVAAVDGVAIGVSMSLALGCDLVIASDRARFGAVFAKVGLTPDGGLSWLLPRLVGPHRAKELTLLARLVDAAEAERIGLVNRVVPADDLAAATEQWCALLADRTPECARGTLALLDDAWSTTLAEALENEAATQQVAVTALRGQDSQ